MHIESLQRYRCSVVSQQVVVLARRCCSPSLGAIAEAATVGATVSVAERAAAAATEGASASAVDAHGATDSVAGSSVAATEAAAAAQSFKTPAASGFSRISSTATQ